MPDKGMSEKRKFARLSIEIPIRWKIVTPASGITQARLDITRDISRGGICFKAHKKIALGSILQLEIKLPNEKIIHTEGRVAWAKNLTVDTLQKEEEYDIGVEFLKILDEDKDEINKFVFEFLTQP